MSSKSKKASVKENKPEKEKPKEIVWTKELENKLMEQWDLVSIEELLEMFKQFSRKEVLAKHTKLLIENMNKEKQE